LFDSLVRTFTYREHHLGDVDIAGVVGPPSASLMNVAARPMGSEGNGPLGRLSGGGWVSERADAIPTAEAHFSSCRVTAIPQRTERLTIDNTPKSILIQLCNAEDGAGAPVRSWEGSVRRARLRGEWKGGGWGPGARGAWARAARGEGCGTGSGRSGARGVSWGRRLRGGRGAANCPTGYGKRSAKGPASPKAASRRGTLRECNASCS
jgi:hypothetical protein